MRRLICILVMSFSAAAARADSIIFKTGEVPGVQIVSVGGGTIHFITNGRDTSRDIQQVVRLQIPDEPALSFAEFAWDAQKYDVATDNYRKALTTTAKPWVKLWSAQRLVEAGQKANRFDAAATGYIALLALDPANAANFKPKPPDAASTYIASAISEVNAALAVPTLQPASKQALQNYLLELQSVRKDEKGVAQTLEKMVQTGTAAANPAAGAALAKMKLRDADQAIQAKQFDKAAGDIVASANVFVDPNDQAQALYLLAEARAGIAATKNDPAAWQDAALSYMRVVAHFPTSPYAASSLLKTGQIEEKLNDFAAARAVYDQLVSQYPGDPAAPVARASSDRLKANP